MGNTSWGEGPGKIHWIINRVLSSLLTQPSSEELSVAPYGRAFIIKHNARSLIDSWVKKKSSCKGQREQLGNQNKGCVSNNIMYHCWFFWINNKNLGEESGCRYSRCSLYYSFNFSFFKELKKFLFWNFFLFFFQNKKVEVGRQKRKDWGEMDPR